MLLCPLGVAVAEGPPCESGSERDPVRTTHLPRRTTARQRVVDQFVLWEAPQEGPPLLPVHVQGAVAYVPHCSLTVSRTCTGSSGGTFLSAATSGGSNAIERAREGEREREREREREGGGGGERERERGERERAVAGTGGYRCRLNTKFIE